MKRPSFVQILAVVNSLLVIVMLFEIQRLRGALRAPVVSMGRESTIEVAEPVLPTADELMGTIRGRESDFAAVQRALHNFSRQGLEDYQGALYEWTFDELPQEERFSRRERLELRDVAVRRLMGSAELGGDMASRLSQGVLSGEEWLPARNQALIHLHLLYLEGDGREAGGGNDAVGRALAEVSDAVLRSQEANLSATLLEGGVYFQQRGLPHPAGILLDEFALKSLDVGAGWPAGVRLQALEYARARDLPWEGAARGLAANPPGVALAIALEQALDER